MTQALAVAAVNRVLDEPRSKAIAFTRDVILVIAGSLLVAGSAQIVIPLPFTPVPITGQTFAVLLVGAALGSGRGSLAMILYLLEGGVGLPFFAQSTSGFGALTGATGGYLVGFVAAAAVVGFLSQRGWDRRYGSAVGAMLTANVVIYLFGVIWLANIMGGSPISQEVLLAGVYPFIPGDLIKIYLAAAALPAAWRLMSKI